MVTGELAATGKPGALDAVRYTDGTGGFLAIGLTNGVGELLR